MNKRGFTLVELLAVLAILGFIMVIAIPTITSSMQRTKVKHNAEREKLLISSAEAFVIDHKNDVYSVRNSDDGDKYCYVSVQELIDNRYLTEDLAKDLDDKVYKGSVKIFFADNTSLPEYEYVENVDKNVKKCSYNVANTNNLGSNDSCDNYRDFKVGDSVSYTPALTSYTTDTSKTGYSSAQTINPKELNLWRVIRTNDDGTVDIISEYISSSRIIFSGQTGFQNLVGYLNILASQYKNSVYTSGSRYFGFNGQTLEITNTSYFVNSAPWTCSTDGFCDPYPLDYEAFGGGDQLYTSDLDLVVQAFGDTFANDVSTGIRDTYWIASRSYRYSESNSSYWFCGRIVHKTGTKTGPNDFYTANVENMNFFGYSNGNYDEYLVGAALRPIVVLKSGAKCCGSENFCNKIVIG